MDKNYKAMLADRFGMFVHYGLYSALAGSYNGEEIFGLGEWIQRRAEIPIDEYVSLTKDAFCPAPDFAEKLVKTAKAAGIKYIVLTSKHHDGFCLFKTAVDGYNSYDFYGRDLCRELMEACHKEGLELGFYYSHTLDWHEKNGAGNYELAHPGKLTTNRNYWDYPDNNIDFEEYYRKKCLPQVRELLTNYGKLKCIWFDYPHDITYDESLELRNLVKELQPDCLINSRIGHGLWDYNSLGDNGLPSTPAKFPTECLITLNHTWGYKSYDKDYKSSRSVIEILCRTLTADSTLLLNVGPMPTGDLTEESYAILSDVGEWVHINACLNYSKSQPSETKCNGREIPVTDQIYGNGDRRQNLENCARQKHCCLRKPQHAGDSMTDFMHWRVNHIENRSAAALPVTPKMA